MSRTFSQFKENFYSRVKDVSVFNCMEFNLLKVVLDGLKVDYLKRGIRNQDIFEPLYKTRFIYGVKRIKYRDQILMATSNVRRVKNTLKARYLFFDNARKAMDANGNQVSFYFNKIEKYLAAENCVTIYQKKNDFKNGMAIDDLLYATRFMPFSGEEQTQIEALTRAYERIKNLEVFTQDELLNIRVAINKFFTEYRFWKFLLKDSHIKVAFFDQHYHREGFILALKEKGILAAELQHGLIASEDIFYVFPEPVAEIAERALFPDKIFTYGSFWSDILKQGYEFRPSQIAVLGVYSETNTHVGREEKKKLDEFLNSGDFILITTQTFLHAYFTEYVEFLSKDLIEKNNTTRIVVKIHPSEKHSNYESLKTLQNVFLSDINTEYLLRNCSWHVSGYSTTLYDAKKYLCKNYSLYIEVCSDYINALVNTGISTLIHKSQNPVFFETTNNIGNSIETDLLYADFETHKHILKEL